MSGYDIIAAEVLLHVPTLLVQWDPLSYLLC